MLQDASTHLIDKECSLFKYWLVIRVKMLVCAVINLYPALLLSCDIFLKKKSFVQSKTFEFWWGQQLYTAFYITFYLNHMYMFFIFISNNKSLCNWPSRFMDRVLIFRDHKFTVVTKFQKGLGRSIIHFVTRVCDESKLHWMCPKCPGFTYHWVSDRKI